MKTQMTMLGPEASLAFFAQLSNASEYKPVVPFTGRKRSKSVNCICDCGEGSDCCGFG